MEDPEPEEAPPPPAATQIPKPPDPPVAPHMNQIPRTPVAEPPPAHTPFPPIPVPMQQHYQSGPHVGMFHPQRTSAIAHAELTWR